MARVIVCGSGGFRTAFIHGVLSAFQTANFRADAYAGTSASAVSAGYAAIGQLAHDVDYWKQSIDLKHQTEGGMSEVMFTILRDWSAPLKAGLFQPDAPRFFVPASAVIQAEAAEVTQSSRARRLGRQLLIAAAKGDDSWAAANLRLDLFDSQAPDENLRLTAANLEEIFYASTRMMHAWDVPAMIAGQPYVDASYRCAIPAVETAVLGYDEVIAISADPGPVYRDIFRSASVPETAPYQIIRPQIDPAKLGADFTDATHDGLEAAFQHGIEQGAAFLK